MRTTFSRFDKGLFLKVHCGSPIFVDCSQNFLLFQRNFSVGPVFMTQAVFQYLLMDNIWMLLLLQRIFSEVPVLMLLYLNLDHFYGCFSSFTGPFRQAWNASYNLRFKLWFFKVFRMVHKKECFRRTRVKYRTFSEGPT